MKIINNNIKDTSKSFEISARLISLWTNVTYSTVSSWNSNVYQPSKENLHEIGELFQIDSRLLLKSDNRINTGLAHALEQELKRLVKEENMPYVLEKEVNGSIIRINNPALIKALKDFAEKYNKENKHRLYPFYFDKPLKDIKKSEIRKANYFICKEDNAGAAFVFQVISYANKIITPIAGFNNLEDAQDYIDYMGSF